MNKLTVLEPPGGSVGTLICERLHRLKGADCLISASISTSMENGLDPDLLIVPNRGEKTQIPQTGSCGVLLIPGAVAAPKGIKAGKVISYGMSGKDSITLSSIGEVRSMLSLRRDLPTLSGPVLECQELPVMHSSRCAPEDTMASAVALLLLGVPPDML